MCRKSTCEITDGYCADCVVIYVCGRCDTRKGGQNIKQCENCVRTLCDDCIYTCYQCNSAECLDCLALVRCDRVDVNLCALCLSKLKWCQTCSTYTDTLHTCIFCKISKCGRCFDDAYFLDETVCRPCFKHEWTDVLKRKNPNYITPKASE